jgi:hypothetical protein
MEREQRERHQQFLGGVDAIITLLASEGREITAAAIAAILDDPVNYPEDEVARALDELHASGTYDEDIALVWRWPAAAPKRRNRPPARTSSASRLDAPA